MNNDEIVKKIKAVMGRGKRFTVNSDDLRSFDPKLANFVVRKPLEAIAIFEDLLNNMIRGFDDD
jgi:DNA replicative helicase MCM subunit Mcm2 (Cdc46/Mcm family)